MCGSVAGRKRPVILSNDIWEWGAASASDARVVIVHLKWAIARFFFWIVVLVSNCVVSFWILVGIMYYLIILRYFSIYLSFSLFIFVSFWCI